MAVFKRLRNVIVYGAYVPTELFVDHVRETIYVQVPKVACTSIKESMFGAVDSDSVDYPNYMKIHSQLADLAVEALSARTIGYFRFAFVRNPFDRLVSCYLDKVVRREQHNGRYYFDSGYNRWLVKGVTGVQISPQMSFPDFVTCVSRVPDWLSDGHFRSQCHILFAKKLVTPHFVGRFETLTLDWNELEQKLKLPPLPHRNPTRPRDLLEWYKNKKLVDRVYKRYSCDIDRWYSAEYLALLEHLP